MGNCMETCVNREQNSIDEKIANNDNNMSNGVVKERRLLRSEKGELMRVKIVVTKEELQWLMIQLSNSNNNNNKGGKSLDDFLGEIERERDHQKEFGQIPWKPSLESIMESTELPQEMDR